MGHDPLAQARSTGFRASSSAGAAWAIHSSRSAAVRGRCQDSTRIGTSSPTAGEQLAQVGAVVQGGLPGGGKSRVGGGGGSGVIVGIVIHQGIIRLYPGFPGVAGLKSTPSPRTCHCSDPPNTFAKRRRHRCRRLRPVAGRGP